jgi:hypothetical protein
MQMKMRDGLTSDRSAIRADIVTLRVQVLVNRALYRVQDLLQKRELRSAQVKHVVHMSPRDY